MATAESVKAKIQGLITQANAATGNEDTDLTTSVNALIAGYGQGGGSGTGLAYDMGEFIFDADIASNSAWIKNNPIPHNLGDTPDFILVWTDHWAGIAEAPYTDNTTVVGFVWLNGLTGMIGRAAASVDIANPLIAIISFPKADYRCSFTNPTSAAYGLSDNMLPTREAFTLANYGATSLWRAGVVYKYFVSKAWWNIGGVASAE